MEIMRIIGGGAMNLFQKIKNSAGKVTDRAQNVVEIGKLNTQITNIEREVGLYYKRMGEVFYEGFQSKDMSKAEKEMVELARTCGLLLEERDEIKYKIADLKNERLCPSCGKSVAKEALFCQFCGSKLPERKESTPAESVEPHTVENVTAAASEWRYDAVAQKDSSSEHNIAEEEENIAHTQEQAVEQPLPLNPEEEAKQQLELDRERKRQEELDRLIANWKEHVTPNTTTSSTTSYSVEGNAAEVAKEAEHAKTCSNCGKAITLYNKWCPHCGAQQ
jgi:uncharacterized OB-fold protein